MKSPGCGEYSFLGRRLRADHCLGLKPPSLLSSFSPNFSNSPSQSHFWHLAISFPLEMRWLPHFGQEIKRGLFRKSRGVRRSKTQRSTGNGGLYPPCRLRPVETRLKSNARYPLFIFIQFSVTRCSIYHISECDLVPWYQKSIVKAGFLTKNWYLGVMTGHQGLCYCDDKLSIRRRSSAGHFPGMICWNCAVDYECRDYSLRDRLRMKVRY